jgi:putative endonuclease
MAGHSRSRAECVPPPHLEAGRLAEALAAKYLQSLGYQLLARNCRFRCGELDIVALDETVLAIVEVRYRAGNRHGGGAGSVTPTKQRRLMRAAQALLLRHPKLARLPARFDVVEVSGPREAMRCRLLRDAFRLPT